MKNYITVTPFIDGDFIEENDEILQTPIINSIRNEIICGDVYDHFFYIDCIEDMEIYESLEDACRLIYDMTAIYFDDYPDINSIIIAVKDYNDNALFYIVVDYIESIDDFKISFIDINENDDECDRDCEHCLYNNDNNSEDSNKVDNVIKSTPIEMFYFGFDW